MGGYHFSEITFWWVALGIGLVVWLAVFLSTPRKRKQTLATSSAQYAAEVGGTRTARMGA